MHDIFTREFVNVAGLLHSPRHSFLGMLHASRLKRLLGFFPGAERAYVGDVLRFVRSRVEQQSTLLSQSLAGEKTSARQIAQAVFPIDDSAFQWGDEGSGIADNPESMLQQLFERLILRHESRQPVVRKEDEDVWEEFAKPLRHAGVAVRLEDRTLKAGSFEHRFEHALCRNGEPHILQPLSFDLVETSGIVEKALRWKALLDHLRTAQAFRVSLLMGAPSESEKRRAFREAEDVMQSISVDKELVSEERADEFAAQLATSAGFQQ